jgi:hypothetical protein
LRIIAMPSITIAILPSSPSLGIWRSSNDGDLDLTSAGLWCFFA